MACAMDGVVAGATKLVWLLVQVFQPACRQARRANGSTASKADGIHANPKVLERVKATPPPVGRAQSAFGMSETKWPPGSRGLLSLLTYHVSRSRSAPRLALAARA